MKNCNKIFKNIPKHKFLHDLFQSKYETGMAAILPLGRSENDEPMSAEVNLFQWQRSGTKDCRFAISHFERGDGTYAGPWLVIDHRTPSAMSANIKFRPWVVSSANEQRKAAFWTGVSAFANLLGPVGNLFFGHKESDQYSIRSQAALSLFGTQNPVTTGATAGSEDSTFWRALPVKPDTSGENGSFTPERFRWAWAAPAGGGQYADFTFEIEYRGTILWGAGREYPDLSATLSQIPDSHIPVGMGAGAAKPWKSLGGAFANLAEQASADAFEAACKPAFAQLTGMGLSPDDARVLLFAHAQQSTKIRPLMPSIPCLTSTDMVRTLERFSVSFALYRPVADKRPLLAVAQQSQNLLVRAPNNALAGYINSDVILYDPDAILALKIGDKVVGGKGTTATRAQFADAMAQAPELAAARCRVATLGGEKAEFAFPNTPSGDGPKDGISVHLGETREGAVVVVVLGFDGEIAASGGRDTKPVLSRYWIGRPPTPGRESMIGDANWEKIRARMAALGKGDGCDRANFKSLIHPPAPSAPMEIVVPPSPVRPEQPANGAATESEAMTVNAATAESAA